MKIQQIDSSGLLLKVIKYLLKNICFKIPRGKIYFLKHSCMEYIILGKGRGSERVRYGY